MTRLNTNGVSLVFFLLLAACMPAATPPVLLTPSLAPSREAVTATFTPLRPEPSVSPTPALTATPAPDTLRSLAEPCGLWIGSAVDPYFIASEPGYADLLKREFNLVTPENAMKFDVVQPKQGQFQFARGDAILRFARANGMSVRGHTLVWDQQLPSWVLEGQYSQEEWKSILKEHIRQVVGHYRGQILAWDVVNEAISDEGDLYNSFWLRAIGPEYIELAFRWAHEADPGALLFYNDHGGEGLGVKADAIYELVKGLKEAGVPIDGVGLQMHIALDGPPSSENLALNLKRLAGLGLIVHITEMDVRTQYSQESMEEKLLKQGEIFQNITATCLQAENCQALVTWGLTDRFSWIMGFTGSPDFPLLFDANSRPKPAYAGVLAALRSAGARCEKRP